MRIGFLSDRYNDPERVGSWSGLPYYFAKNFREAGCEIIAIRGRDAMGSLTERMKQAAWKLAGKRYLRGLNAGALRAYGESVQPLLKSERIDVVFSVNTWLLAYLETDLPKVFWTDATFASMVNFYASFSGLAPVSLRAGHEVERRALANTTLAAYFSNWAADSAKADYGAEPSRLVVLPCGANLEPMPTLEDVRAGVEAKLRPDARATCELACITIDWKRKGADVAVATAVELNRRGIPTRLRIAGCQPPPGVVLPPNVEILGFLNKNSAEGQRKLQDLYRESHFFILPSRAEAFGVVLSEACSFGVPCLTTAVGGLPDVIHPGTNGQLFPLDSPAAAYADWIAAAWADPGEYRRLALATKADYDDRLCGRKAVGKLVELMRGLARPEASPAKRP